MVLNGYSDEYPSEDNQDEDLENMDYVAEEIASWSNFSQVLRKNDRVLFDQMLNEVCQYENGIKSKGYLFKVESLLMSLIFVQQKMIKELINNSKEKNLGPIPDNLFKLIDGNP
jgi:hypothetical protein